MTVKELINLNFGISGIIGIKDVDSLADESIEVLKGGVKDKKLKEYYDWEVVAQFPLFISLDEGNKLKKALLFWRRKRIAEKEDLEYRPIIALAVCNHVVSEPTSDDDEEETDEELPKNYK